MAAAIVDTGVLYAMADGGDRWHDRVKTHLQTHAETLIVPVTVLTEACYLLNRHLGQDAERQLVLSIIQGEMSVENLTADDLRRTLSLLDSYADANIGFADSTIVALAERLKIRRILTTDRRDFALIRPRHCSHFELLP